MIASEEKKQWLKDEIQKKGLYYAVRHQLDGLMTDRNNSEYTVECANNILDLIETFGEKFGISKNAIKRP